MSRFIPHQILLMWLTTACHLILHTSTVFVHQIHLAAYGLLDTGCTQSAVSFPDVAQNSLRIPCSEKSPSIPGFPGLWPPCIVTLCVVHTAWWADCAEQQTEIYIMSSTSLMPAIPSRHTMCLLAHRQNQASAFDLWADPTWMSLTQWPDATQSLNILKNKYLTRVPSC